MGPPEKLPPSPDRAPELDEDFSGGLTHRWWVAAYLPHWTTPDRAAARYGHVAGGLELRIDEDQPDWRPEDAPLRVSNLQTGAYAGPLGSARGTHRHRDDGLVVRTETPLQLCFAPSSGRAEITVSATRDAGAMLAAWLVGTEHLSEADSGEICVFEIDADAIGATTRARTGVKAHHDRRLTTDMAEVTIPLDASRPHTWTVIWGGGETVIGCDGVVVRRIPQAPDYPLFLMIDLFEVGPPSGTYPKSALVHRVRGWIAS
ncbi:family 16 glycosylhydrolase [Microbacterium sp. CPCC 204701]|uniref:family 16 glycosylhydrolase n=1 Tax=Microbacterium sp. CPCC 204701 TaxID=2493084 RepID=UPI000FDA1851|nr:family 16 glycosylhydrolase [Microbacterium sp. CPCC 204701]